MQCTVYKFQNQYATHVGEMRSRQWNIPVLKYTELHNCITDQKYQNKKNTRMHTNNPQGNAK